MNQTVKKFFENRFYIEITAAITLFAIAVATDSVIEIIINLLYFIIILEIVRALVGYLKENTFKTKFLIDASIILTLREFIVNVVKINNEQLTGIEALFASSVNYHILVFSGVLIFLFFLRWLSIITSTNRKNSFKKQD
jgi:uncharacterized membrane protein (DUF373 family)